MQETFAQEIIFRKGKGEKNSCIKEESFAFDRDRKKEGGREGKKETRETYVETREREREREAEIKLRRNIIRLIEKCRLV